VIAVFFILIANVFFNDKKSKDSDITDVTTIRFGKTCGNITVKKVREGGAGKVLPPAGGRDSRCIRIWFRLTPTHARQHAVDSHRNSRFE
jgi:hypothetical protein